MRDPTPPEAGTHVLADRYDLLEPIGSGGAGVVWRGHDRVLDRSVALKLLHRDLAGDARASERFRVEAAAAAKLTHPHAVVLYDIGQSEAGDYLVMELVEGGTLADVLDGGPLAPGVAAALGTQIARALGAAHDAGLVHRDVKPGNVLLTSEGLAKVTDFGIARALGEATSRLTLPGHVMGTARYLAPEQLRDDPVDARADVYALGLLLHHAISARPPFGEGSAAEVAMRRLAATVPPLSELYADVSPELEAVIARATRLDPDERFEDGSALAVALATHADRDAGRELTNRLGEPVASSANRRPPSRPGTAALPRADTSASVPSPGDVAHPDPQTTTRTPLARGLPATPGPLNEPTSPPDGPPPSRRGVWLVLLAFLVIGAGAVLATTGDDPEVEVAEQPSANSPPDVGPIDVVDGGDHDPFGSGEEHADRVANAYDGDLDTNWHTQRYRGNPQLGGLKPGVGIWLDLGESHEIVEVVVSSASPGATFTVYAGDDPPSPDADPDDWGLEVGRIEEAGEEASLALDEPVDGRVWLLWFTSLPPDGDRFRATVADVTLVGS